MTPTNARTERTNNTAFQNFAILYDRLLGPLRFSAKVTASSPLISPRLASRHIHVDFRRNLPVFRLCSREDRHIGGVQMPDRAKITDNLEVEQKLIILLRNHNYKFLLRFFDHQFGFKFRTEQSGATFTTCIDWCARNGGNIDAVKRLVLLIFDRFYRYLPASVREDFADMAEEVGFTQRQPIFHVYDRLLRRLLFFRA